MGTSERKTDGQLLSEAQDAWIAHGNTVADDFLRSLLSSPHNYDMAVHLHGVYWFANGVNIAFLRKLDGIIRDTRLDTETRGTCAAVVFQRVHFQKEEFYRTVQNLADYVIQQQVFGRWRSEAKSCLEWLNCRMDALRKCSEGVVCVSDDLLSQIVLRREFSERGFTTSQRHIAQLMELVVTTTEGGLDCSLTVCREHGAFPFERAELYQPNTGKELFFTQGKLICPVPKSSGGLGCVWDSDPTCQRFRLRDAQVTFV